MKKLDNGEKVYFHWALDSDRLVGTYVGLTADKKHHVIDHHGLVYIVDDDQIHKIKPKIIVNGIEVNAPMRERPREGTDCYCRNEIGEIRKFNWGYLNTGNNKFKVGIFDNEEDAQAYYDALYKPVREYLGGIKTDKIL